MKTECTYCGSPVDTDRAWRMVTGWEHPRKAGGTNALALRSPHQKWACDTCIRERKHPQTEGQKALWG